MELLILIAQCVNNIRYRTVFVVRYSMWRDQSLSFNRAKKGLTYSLPQRIVSPWILVISELFEKTAKIRSAIDSVESI